MREGMRVRERIMNRRVASWLLTNILMRRKPRMAEQFERRWQMRAYKREGNGL